MLALLTACGGGSAAPVADGPVKVSVATGNNQTVAAARDARLPKEVGVQAVRLPNGQSGLRLLDALLPPKAYAQTGVTSVPGIVACPVSPDPKHALIPEVPCTSTGADGIAWFTFHHDSVAGRSMAQVRATVDRVTVVTDSVVATILPGPASPTYRTQSVPIQSFPATVAENSVQDQYGNPVPFRIISDGRIVVQDTTTGSVGARTIVAGPDAQTDYTVELRGINGALVGHALYRINNGQLLGWMAAGVSLTP
jgi:hypothetical protein